MSSFARLAVGVYLVDDAAPCVYIALFARHQQPVAEAIMHTVQEERSVGKCPRLRHRHRKPPAIDSSVPLAVTGAAKAAVQPNIGGSYPVVGCCPFAPGVNVIDKPAAVPVLAGQHVGVKGQRRRRQIERVVADNVIVILKMGNHLCVAALAVPRLEAPLDLQRIACPVEAGRLAHQRAAAAVEHAANHAMLRVIVVGLGSVPM